ncbi:MAG: flagellar biosynthesis protein FlhA [Bacillota bacterium]|nr:flagellar biosynthesis protein FlhA [Bacillota bacterium]MDI7248812.1 flagellar biosynthesis protein FlhA [Bacillota bacterium]
MAVAKQGDLALAGGLVLVLAMLVVPIPPLLLDLLLSFNLAFSLLILLATTYLVRPLDLAAFPSLLLVLTLFRLSLTVASTRLILLNASAGQVIGRFGEFVIGASPAIGVVVFLILVLVQFLVITRGAERIAEVAARFTLDAMPGKQMAIDADLQAGNITEEEARERRRLIQREADFFGAMDGASKFVRGDAIAALLVMAIDVVGGLLVGVLQRGMPLADALNLYVLLTVGQGLAIQIPALLISIAAGMLVTRSASGTSLGEEVGGQLLAYPRALGMAAGVVSVMGLVPGLPHLPFLGLGALLAVLALVLRNQRERERAEEERRRREEELEALRRPESIFNLMRVDPLEVELGYSLIPLADARQGGDLLERVVMIRRQVALDLGVVIPPVRVRDNIAGLAPNAYTIKVRGVEVQGGELYPNRLLAMNPGDAPSELEGIPTREPAFGLPALWIAREDRDRAEMAGWTVVEPSAVLATHLTEVIRANAHLLLGRQEVREMLDALKETHAALVEELIPGLLSLGEIQKVLANLVREGVSIRDLVLVAEALADHARTSRDTDYLTEMCRQALARVITRQFGLDRGPRPVATLHPEAEKTILEGVEAAGGGLPALDAGALKALSRSLSAAMAKVAGGGHIPVLLCQAAARPHVRRLVEKLAPRMAVLSYAELDETARIEPVATVTLSDDA